MVEAVTGNPFLDGLLERAPASASTPKRGQNYNYPERLYLLPDDDFVDQAELEQAARKWIANQ